MRKIKQVFTRRIVQPPRRPDQRWSVGVAVKFSMIIDTDDRGVIQVME
jgi:hypothetical protein